MPESRSPTTLINGGWIVAFDGERHRILRDGVVVYQGDIITHVGKSYEGAVDRTIDARAHLVSPGLVNAHVHVGAHTGDRMIFDAGRAELFRSGFMNYCTSKGINGPTIHDFEDPDVAIRYSLSCLLRFGSTTIVEMGGELGGESENGELGPLASHAGELGIRIYMSPGMRSAHHYYDQDGRHQIRWHADDGLATLDRALAFVEKYDGAYEGRVRAILVPLEYHLSSHELLRRTKAAARQYGIGITLHLAESVLEFQDSIRHTGRTPVGMLHDLDFLGPEVVLGHGLLYQRSLAGCLHSGERSRVARRDRHERRPLPHRVRPARGLPRVLSTLPGCGGQPRHRHRLLSAGHAGRAQDRRPGGKDRRPGLRGGQHPGRVQRRHPGRGAGARPGRPGPTRPGARADILIVDFQRARVGPFLDPIKALIQCCDGEVIDTVIVAGQIRVEKGRVLMWDQEELLEGVRRSCANAWSRFADYWPDNEPIEAVFPSAFERWEE